MSNPERSRLPDSRKIALGVGAVAVAASLLWLDGEAGKRIWPLTETQLIGASHEEGEALTLTFPGLGSLGGAEQARHIGNIIVGPSAYFDYSSSKISTAGLADKLAHSAPNLTQLNLNGHSMGGPFGLEVARQTRIPGLELGHVVLHCSPFDISDARQGTIAKALKVIRWPTGPGIKFIFQVIKCLYEGEPLNQVIDKARREAISGSSPSLWLSQLESLGVIDLNAHKGEFEKLIGENTIVTYCMPEDPQRDTIVDTVQASDKYAQFFADLNVRYQVLRIPDAGHANVGLGCAHLAQLLLSNTAFFSPDMTGAPSIDV